MDSGAGPPRGDSATAARPLVALFLLLLVFFLVMCAGAQYDGARTRKALDSLATAFPAGSWFGEGGRPGGEAAMLQQRIAGLFETMIAVARVTIVERGHLMEIELPASTLFDETAPAVRPAIGPLMQRLGEALVPSARGPRIAATFFQRPAPGVDRALAAARAEAVAVALLDRGMPAAAIQVGREAGPTGSVRFEFRSTGAEPAPGPGG